MHRSTWLHLRIPFSLYLMPVFCFAASQYPLTGLDTFLLAFITIHLFLYPASNGYNSFFDKDTESIGGLENPPPVKLELYYISLVFDVIAIGLGLLISWQFSLMLFIYGLVSKAYSHPMIRLKKYGVAALLTAAVFQGGFTYMMTYLALHHLQFSQLNDINIIIPAILSSAMILGFYPMTQIYQHNEDATRGDMTASYMLGVRGTFIFSAIVFLGADLGFYYYFTHYQKTLYFILFDLFLSPLFGFFILWYWAWLQDKSEANFRNAMLLNKIAAFCLISFFMVYAFMQGR